MKPAQSVGSQGNGQSFQPGPKVAAHCPMTYKRASYLGPSPSTGPPLGGVGTAFLQQRPQLGKEAQSEDAWVVLTEAGLGRVPHPDSPMHPWMAHPATLALTPPDQRTALDHPRSRPLAARFVGRGVFFVHCFHANI